MEKIKEIISQFLIDNKDYKEEDITYNEDGSVTISDAQRGIPLHKTILKIEEEGYKVNIQRENKVTLSFS